MPHAQAGRAPERISFSNGSHELVGWLWKPDGQGPFPVILDNHGSEKTPMPEPTGPPLPDEKSIADMFLAHGYMYFYPERRGHGNSHAAGPYIMDLVRQDRARNGKDSGDALMVRLLETDHVADVLAALRYLQSRPDVRDDQVVVMGSSFGGVLALLAAEHDGFVAAVDFAGGAMNWPHNTALRTRMLAAAGHVKTPVLLIQAENDFDLGPTRELWAEMTRLGKTCKMHIYPPQGHTKRDGHRFITNGVAIWSEEVTEFIRAAVGPSKPQ
ncbi:MAG TPA: alpha/beta fold hydrolase [Bryobacteraceae bacterium]|nr:alpha/beta fold hydrolase [Bryobacteraceae bacterium]